MRVRARCVSILLGISLVLGSVNPAALAAEQQTVDDAVVLSENVETVSGNETVSGMGAEGEAVSDSGTENKTDSEREPENVVETDIGTGSSTEIETGQEAERGTESEDEYTYSGLDDGTVEITEYTGGETDVRIPELLGGKQVTSIGYAAFFGCQMTSVTIPDGVISIGGAAFKKCGSLESVYIPDSVTSIGEYAFSECSMLSRIDFPKSVAKIEEGTFHLSDNLKDIYFSGSRMQWENLIAGQRFGDPYIGDNTFNDPLIYAEIHYADVYEYSILDDGTVEVTKYSGEETDVRIPESWGGLQVTAIGDQAYWQCNMTSVTIPDSVTRIGESAFGECARLESITIPNGVTSIKQGAFGGCVGLKSVTIPGSVTEIGEKAFERCSSLESITIPDGVASIGWMAFSECVSLESAHIPDSVTSISGYAFSKCGMLSRIDFPKSVTVISTGTFEECKNLEDIYFSGNRTQWKNIEVYDSPNTNYHLTCAKIHYGDVFEYGSLEDGTVEITGYCGEETDVRIPELLGEKQVSAIGDAAFLECGITSVTVPDGVAKIGDRAFCSCKSLKSIVIPDSVTRIGEGAFAACRFLEGITIPDGVTSIEYDTFGRCENLKSVTIPDSVTEIGRYAFSECGSLESVYIPDSVRSIGGYAFSECRVLSRIDFPKSVIKIEDYTFNGCENIRHVYFSGSRIQWEDIDVVGEGNDCFRNAEIHYADDTENTDYDCRVSFNTCKVAAIPDCTVKAFSLLEKPQDPFRPEYTFIGWYYQDKKWDFERKKVTEDMTLEARWEAAEKVTVKENGEKVDNDGYEIWLVERSKSFHSCPTYKGTNGSAGYAKNSTTWSVSDPAVVSISPTSGDTTRATAISAGTAIVGEKTESKLYENNSQTGKIELVESATTVSEYKVRVVDKVSSITIAPAMELEQGQSSAIDFSTVPLGNYVRYMSNFELVSSDETVVTIREDGVATAVGCGQAVITARTKNGYGKVECQAQCQVTVKNPEGGEGSYTVVFDYNGHGVIQGESPRYNGVKAGSAIQPPNVPEDKDFKFTGWYKEAACTTLWNFETDKITGDTTLYAGWEEKGTNPGTDPQPWDDDDSAYTDEERTSLSSVSATIANIKPKVYDGSAYEPTVKVKAIIDGKNTILTEGTDYRVLYQNNINAGSATVTIRGNGLYKGSQSKTYTINAKAVKKLKVITGGVAAGSSPSELPVYVYDGCHRLVPGKDYTLSGDASGAVIIGKGNYTGLREAKFATYNVDSSRMINPENVKLDVESVTYTGKAVKSVNPIVTTDGTVLTKNKDYTVRYQNNKDVGNAFVIVTGKGGYKGKVIVPFQIVAEEISSSAVAVKPVSDKTYNGTLQKPGVTVSVLTGGKLKKLKKNKDYTVSYKNNLHAGTAAFTVTGKGNYKGLTASGTFIIRPQNISKVSVKAAEGSLMLTYKKHVLKEGTDYAMPEYGAVSKNKIDVILKGTGDFTGTVVKKVKIK